MNFNDAEFVLSAASVSAVPSDGLPQIVFAGRSNVGKSSVINRLLERKNLARIGSAPGKTTHINFFLIGKVLYFVDLPGYGYAKVSKAEKERWAKLIEAYFQHSQRITLGIVIVDARHKPTQNDITMVDWFKNTNRPFVVVANKLDKLKKSEIKSNLLSIGNTLELDDGTPLIPFSAEKGTGREELIGIISSAAGQ